MTRVLVVVDMQQDFLDGALGSPQALSVIDPVAERIERAHADGERCFFTLDTHTENYLETTEGRALPVVHCVKGSKGHALHGKIAALVADGDTVIEKPAFGGLELMTRLSGLAKSLGTPDGADMRIELCGLYADICVIANALLIKTQLPEAEIVVQARLTAGVDDEKYRASLIIMRSCQIKIVA